MIRLAAVFCLLTSYANPQVIGHGTCVFTFTTGDFIVMAADGETHLEQPIGHSGSMYTRTVKAAEPKIAVCGARHLLCGMAGVNPITFSEFQIKYNFQDWITTVIGNKNATVTQYAYTIQKQARKTFRNIDSVLKTNEFWNSDIAKGRYFIYFPCRWV